MLCKAVRRNACLDNSQQMPRDLSHKLKRKVVPGKALADVTHLTVFDFPV